MEKWPNFFIVGTSKAGTTSLNNYLTQHPEIYMSSIKEPKFFCSSQQQRNATNQCIVKEKDYLRLFKNAKNEKIVGEASVRYMVDPKSPELIHQKVPNAYILISLRDPVESCFSRYLMYKHNNKCKASFGAEIEKAINSDDDLSRQLVEYSLYSQDVQRYIDTFGKGHVKIIIFEEFIKNIYSAIKEILDFLDVEKNFDFKPEIYNSFKIERSFLTHIIIRKIGTKIFIKKYVPNKVRKLVSDNLVFKKGKKPEMTKEERLKLTEYFKEDVQQLETLLGRKLPWSNFFD